MGTQKSFLDRIFRILVRQYDRACYRVRPSLMQSNQSGKTPVVARLGKANELPFFIRNTNRLAGLLGQRGFPGALLQTYWRPASDVRTV